MLTAWPRRGNPRSSRRNPLKRLASQKEFDLEFVPKNLVFVPPELDFVPPDLESVPEALDSVPTSGRARPPAWELRGDAKRGRKSLPLPLHYGDTSLHYALQYITVTRAFFPLRRTSIVQICMRHRFLPRSAKGGVRAAALKAPRGGWPLWMNMVAARQPRTHAQSRSHRKPNGELRPVRFRRSGRPRAFASRQGAFISLTAAGERTRPDRREEDRTGHGPSRLGATDPWRLRFFPGSTRQNSTRCSGDPRASRRRG